MRLSVAVYQRREGKRMTWRTLGLGAFDQVLHGRRVTQLQQRLTETLKAALTKATPGDLRAFVAPLDVSLETVALQFTARNGEGRRKVRGHYPLVLETRHTGTEPLCVAWHPARPDEWFPVPAGGDLVQLATKRFIEPWAPLSDEELSELTASARDALRLVSFDADPPSLLDALTAPDKRRAGRDRPPRPVLPQVGRDETVATIDAPPTDRPRPALRAQLQRLIAGERPSPVVLIGPPGSGRRTLLRRAVHDLMIEDGYPNHRNLDRVRHVWRISGQRIIAGMVYLGEWEARAGQLVAEARQRRAILWADDLAAFGRVGRARDSDRCLADVFVGPLTAGELLMVGVATADAWQRLSDDSPTLAAAFTQVQVPPTDADETLAIALEAARALEEEYEQDVDHTVFAPLIALTDALYPDLAFPGKAIALLRRTVRDGVSDYDWISKDEIVTTLAERSGLSEDVLEPDTRPDQVLDYFARHIVGQPAAIQAAADVVVRICAGLTDPRRPYAVLLFTGPTGTGKTELARRLADWLYDGDYRADQARLVRFDMSEYNGPDAAARLIGDRWQPVGALTRRVRAQPFCVLLLDEIEKAHPSVLNLLLQLFEDGRLSDATGAVTDFTHVVVVMTSNLGAQRSNPVGFGAAPDAVLRDVDRAVKAFFPPELFNRIDQVVRFGPLSLDAATTIARHALASLASRPGLSQRQVRLEARPAVHRRIAELAFDPRDGARPIKRFVEAEIGGLLTNYLVDAEPVIARRARVQLVGDGFALDVDALREAEPLEARFAIDAVRPLNAETVRAALVQTLERLEARVGPAGGELAQRISAHLSAARDGDAAQADALHALESQRSALVRLRAEADATADDERALPALRRPRRTRLAREVPPPARTLRPEAGLDLLAEAVALERVLLGPPEDAEAPVFIYLEAVGLELTELLPALAYSYCEGRRVVGWAGLTAIGELHAEAGAPARWALRNRGRRAVLEVAGFGALDALMPETGTHVFVTEKGAVEIVQVEVWRADERGAEAALRARLAAIEAFHAARDPGAPDPTVLRPVVRLSRRESNQSKAGTYLVEDFLTGSVSQSITSEMGRVFRAPRRLLASREAL